MNQVLVNSPLASLHKLVWTALMAALISVGAYIFIPFPLSPVPFTLQTMFVILAGFVLGPWYGAGASLLYLAAGFMGLPVFSGGKSGFAHLMGPTGGYLVGFVLCSFISGFAVRRGGDGDSESARIFVGKDFMRALAWGLLGLIALFAAGVAWLAHTQGMTLQKALVVGMLPFAWSSLIKLIAAAGAQQYLRRWRMTPV